jgi:hypothetical protein
MLCLPLSHSMGPRSHGAGLIPNHQRSWYWQAKLEQATGCNDAGVQRRRTLLNCSTVLYCTRVRCLGPPRPTAHRLHALPQYCTCRFLRLREPFRIDSRRRSIGLMHMVAMYIYTYIHTVHTVLLLTLTAFHTYSKKSYR